MTIFSLLLSVAVFLTPLAGQRTGQIAGRVVRADTGMPIEGVVITLQPDEPSPDCPGQENRVAKTSADGTYTIPDLLPGCYNVVAYHAAFLGAIYGAPAPRDAGKLVKVVAGQKVASVDFRLSLVPDVTAMNDQFLDAHYPDLRHEMTFGPGRFSPDGRSFAMIASGFGEMDTLWRYDLRTQDLVSLGAKNATDLAWDGERLVVMLNDPQLVNGKSFAALTPDGLKPISQVPDAVKQIFANDERGDGSTIDNVQRNDRYVITSDRPCHGCGTEVKVHRKGEQRDHVIATGLTDGILFDHERSAVIYFEQGIFPALVVVDLDSGISRTIWLPTPAVAALLDGRSEPGGYLVAFVSAGSCLPEVTSDGQNPWILPNNLQYRHAHSFPANVCFVKVPAQARDTGVSQRR